VPEGDTLQRTASGLAPHLVGRVVSGARAKADGPQVQRIVGATITGETRAEAIHPTLARLGPDLLDDGWGVALAAEALRRLRDPVRARWSISAALLDQQALAGIGNIWRNETLFHERVWPWSRVADLDDATLDRLVARAHDLLRASVDAPTGRSPLWVYRRAGRPCHRCGMHLRSAERDVAVPRTTFWCPACQPPPVEP